jgi:glycolate oxidase iron-sulfur subunit
MKSSVRGAEPGMRKEKKHGPLDRYRAEIARCVKCGSCSAACPAYLFSRAESHSARGRMALIRAALDGRIAVSGTYRDRLATCTTCLACEANCASGVHVTEIIQAAKEQAAEEAGTGPTNAILGRILRNNRLLRATAWLAPFALHYSEGAIRGRSISSESGVRSSGLKVQGSKARQKGQTGKFRGRVVFFPGCAIEQFQPDIGSASIRVLNRMGYDVVVPRTVKCCGRPLLSLGDRKGAEELAAHNSEVLAGLGADAVVTACASCGLTFKREYPKLLRPGAKAPAVLDIHEFLAREFSEVRLAPIKKVVTVHDPCHLGRGQGLSGIVRDLLRRVPEITLLEMENADRCCGFGGVMRVTHRALSDGIAEEKARSIIATGASVVATGCPGCRMQIANALRRAEADAAVLHPVQVLEEAMNDE